MKKLIKSEILWTRKCNLRCQYCNMWEEPGIINKDINQWKQGLRNLKKLDCEFIAIYGAEPLMDMTYLDEFIKESNDLNMFHTLITNCSVPDAKEKIKYLVKKGGLNSLTVSFDGTENELKDKSSSVKSSNGIETLKWFQKEFPTFRDTAVVFTLTKTNLFNILDWIPKLSQENIFVFFDLIHNDIGNPGTKCKNYSGIENLLFTENDKELIVEFGKKLLELKQTEKYKIHQSYSFINELVNNPEIYINHSWNCAKECVFPSWITVDNSGIVRVCDDFYIKGDKDWYFWDLNESNFEEFSKYWKDLTLKNCKGCFWNTHYDANCIKKGEEYFNDYINQGN